MSRNLTRIPVVLLTIALVAAVFGIQGCAAEKTDSAQESTTDQAGTEPSATPQEPQEGALYTSSYKPNGKEVAVIETDKGTIKFVVQGGDPLSKTDDPMVGTGDPGYKLKAEFNSRQHLDGSVAMARSQDPDSAGSQFYICLGPQPFLDGNYTVFGQVTEGMDVVRAITAGDVMKSVIIENANQ